MKKLIPAMLICLCITAVCAAGQQEKILLVKVCDRAKKLSYELMTPNEYKTLQAEIKAESMLSTKAMMLAQKEWKANEETKKKRFPRSAISLRKATILGQPFKDRQKADDKLYHYQDKAEEKEDRDKEREKKKIAGKSKEKIAKAEEKVREREYLYDQARAIFESKLTELLNPPEKQKKQ